jgi:hypothetical protein
MRSAITLMMYRVVNYLPAKTYRQARQIAQTIAEITPQKIKAPGLTRWSPNKLKRPLPLSPPRAQRAAPKSPKIREGYSGLPLAPFITGR